MEDRIREFDGVTYKDLFLSSIDVVYIRRLDIVQKPGSHASLYLEAVLDGEQEENELQNISKTMTLMYRTEGETRPLFYGVIDKIFIRFFSEFFQKRKRLSGIGVSPCVAMIQIIFRRVDIRVHSDFF